MGGREMLEEKDWRKPGLFVASLCERRPEGRIPGGVEWRLDLSLLRGEVADLDPRRR
jgi:hypothetical protein